MDSDDSVGSKGGGEGGGAEIAGVAAVSETGARGNGMYSDSLAA